ncbi:MAG: hypothetical protein AB4352_14145 [Hormoscilla sp.]
MAASGRTAFGYQRTAFAHQRTAFRNQRRAFCSQRLAFKTQRTAFSYQRTAFSYQRTAFNYQPIALGEALGLGLLSQGSGIANNILGLGNQIFGGLGNQNSSGLFGSLAGLTSDLEEFTGGLGGLGGGPITGDRLLPPKK